MKKVLLYLFMLLVVVNAGCTTCNERIPKQPQPGEHQITIGQARQIGLQFRELSDLLVRYRYAQWTQLSAKEQYYIENIEWSLINFCSDYTGSGISLYSEDAKALFCRITDRTENVTKEVSNIIASHKENTGEIKALGTWAMKLGAAIASDNASQVKALLKSYNVSPSPEEPASFADPELSRKIGLNFGKISDLILAFHYRNWNQFSSDQRTSLGNIEIILLNYNSNFGGLGIKLGKGEKEDLIEKILVKTGAFVNAMALVSTKDVNFYDQVTELGNRVLSLGAAITVEDVPEINRILNENVTFDGFKLGRKLGLEFRNMASLLLQYRYKNWDSLTKEEKYHLENLEFTLTNFNSDFAVFGVRIDPDTEKELTGEIDSAIKRITASLSRKDLAYEPFFMQGARGLKLGAAILTEKKSLIKKMAALWATPGKQQGNSSSDALAREIALKTRIISNTLLKQRYENWNSFTKKEGGDLGNIEWTLMNFTSNFSVLGIDLDPRQRQATLECAARRLDGYIEAIGGLKVETPQGRAELFQLGMKALKTGATLTTEDIPAIEDILGTCN